MERDNYCSSLRDLVECLRQIHLKWEEYTDALDAVPSTVPLETQRLSQRGGRGRPRFEISLSWNIWLLFPLNGMK